MIGLMKNDLSGQIMKEFVGLRANWTAQIENKITHLEKKKKIIKKIIKKLIKNNKLILKKYKKDLKVKSIMKILKKLIRLL